MNASTSEWIKCRTLLEKPLGRLLCFPWAGGNSTTFFSWTKPFAERNIEVWTVELPGRLARLNDNMPEKMNELVESVFASIKRHWSKAANTKIGLFGHSMGGRVCYEVAKKLHLFAPSLIVFVSASVTPMTIHPWMYEKKWSELTFPEAVDRIRKMGGTPEEVLQCQEIMEMAVKASTLDFDLLSNYHLEFNENKKENDDRVLNCDIVVIHANEDPMVNEKDLLLWKELSHEKCSFHSFTGNHFFITEAQNKKKIIDLIAKNILQASVSLISSDLGV